MNKTTKLMILLMVIFLPSTTFANEKYCLTEALYFEARNQSTNAIKAVGNVIINRKHSKYFPNSICGVVRQGGTKRHRCQFSYYCDGLPDTFSNNVVEKRALERIKHIVNVLLSNKRVDNTNGADHYHTTNVNPNWANKNKITKQLGDHIFYKLY